MNEKKNETTYLISSLITRTNRKKFHVKIIDCGDYVYAYRYDFRTKKNKFLVEFRDKKNVLTDFNSQSITKTNKNNFKTLIILNFFNYPNKTFKLFRTQYTKSDFKNLKRKVFYYHLFDINDNNNLIIRKINIDYLFKQKNINKKEGAKEIAHRSIQRSKFNLQRLVKANEKEFKTFITLTFKDNITDLTYANVIFNNWCRQIRRVKSDFKYICVPEFQKRGAIHYHLLTNLEVNKDVNIIIPQEGKTNQYDVRFWKYGFTSVFPLENINIVGYISKYMTKDVDNRLFGRRRYFYSQNLKKPKEYLIDLDSDDFLIMLELISDKEEVFKKTYLTKNGETVLFTEYKKI